MLLYYFAAVILLKLPLLLCRVILLKLPLFLCRSNTAETALSVFITLSHICLYHLSCFIVVTCLYGSYTACAVITSTITE